MNTETTKKLGTTRVIDSKSYEAGSVGLYVGTFHKYNCGSLDGRWWYLCNYADMDDLLADIAEYHADETDPEYMVQDWDNLPHGVTASDMGECIDRDKLEMLFELEQSDDKELVEDYLGTGQNIWDYADFDELLDAARNACVGTLDTQAWNPFRDWAVEFFIECNDIPEKLIGYLDEEKIEREFGWDFHPGEKYVFSKN